MSAPEEEITGPGQGGGEASAEVTIEQPRVDDISRAESAELAIGPYWRHRRFLVTSAVYIGVWLLMVALIQTGTPPSVYFVMLLPFYIVTLLIAMRTPKQFRKKKEKTLRDRLSFTNRLTLAILAFIAIYIPFTFISNRIIPYAPIVEFFVFIAAIFLLYRLVGRSVGVAPSLEALPPANHRRHKQVVLPIDDPHYQRTLFLNYEFVDRGRGGRQLSKRLENAMESLGVNPERRRDILEDLDGYHEGFHWGLSRRGREKNQSRRERRSQLLKTIYNKFNLELEQGT